VTWAHDLARQARELADTRAGWSPDDPLVEALRILAAAIDELAAVPA
jgi:hypothetical protein